MAIGIGISPIFKKAGTSWSSYWSSLISAVIENAAPTKVVMTFSKANISLVAADFTIAGKTITLLERDVTSKILTLTVLDSILVFEEDLIVTFKSIYTHAIKNNIADDTNTTAWYDSQELSTITKNESNQVSLWKDKFLQISDGAEYVLYGDNETQKTTVAAGRVTTAQSNEQKHTGTYSSKVVHTADVGLHYLYIGVTAGRQYNVSVWVYIPSGQANVDTITLGSSGGGNFASTNTKDVWVQLSAIVIPGFASFSLAAGSDSSENEYWYFDDWTIKEVDVAHDLVQATADYMPIWSSDGILLDGSNDYMQTRPFTVTQPSTIYMVVKFNTLSTGYILDTAWRATIDFYPVITGGLYSLRLNTTNSILTLEGYNFVVIRIKLNGVTSSLQLNDYAALSVDGLTSNMDGLTIGAKYNIGVFSNAEFREIIIRNGIDSDADYNSIYNYLTTKHSAYLSLFGAFSLYSGNPILVPTAPSTYATFASVLKVGSTYHMYYHAGTGSFVYHATSPDGLSWTKDDVNNPVLSVGTNPDWDFGSVGVPMVWYEAPTWYMLYRGSGVTQGNDAVGLATSSDGINWTKEVTNPVLEGVIAEWDANGAEIWGIIKVGATYYTYYEATGATGREIGIATSTDLINWTKDINNPIFLSGRFCPFVFKYEEYYYMLVPHYTYTYDYSEIEIYKDSSPTFYSANREYLGVIKKPSASGWDSSDQDTPVILTDDIFRDTFTAAGGKLWLYYAGDAGPFPDGNNWSTGLLISDGL